MFAVAGSILKTDECSEALLARVILMAGYMYMTWASQYPHRMSLAGHIAVTFRVRWTITVYYNAGCKIYNYCNSGFYP
jgi:hypothetical protein